MVPRPSLVAAEAEAPRGPRLLVVTPLQAATRVRQAGAAGITPGQAPVSRMVSAAFWELSQTEGAAGAACPTTGVAGWALGSEAAELSGPAAHPARRMDAINQGVRRMGGKWSCCRPHARSCPLPDSAARP